MNLTDEQCAAIVDRARHALAHRGENPAAAEAAFERLRFARMFPGVAAVLGESGMPTTG